MRRTLMVVSTIMVVVLVGLFVAGAASAQGPARNPNGNPPQGRFARASLAEYKSVADLLSTAPGQLLDLQLAGRTLLDIGTEKNVTQQELADAILAARKAAVDQAVKDGRLTQAQADQRAQQQNDASVSRLITGTVTAGSVPGSSTEYKAMADVVAMTPGQLLDAEVGGKSLLQIGQDANVTGQQLADAVVTAFKAGLDQAVQNGAGRLTQEQANSMVERLKGTAAADLVAQFSALNTTGPLGGGGGMRPGGPGGARGGRGGLRGNGSGTATPDNGTPAPDSTPTA
jgi:hypothetical protein